MAAYDIGSIVVKLISIEPTSSRFYFLFRKLATAYYNHVPLIIFGDLNISHE